MRPRFRLATAVAGILLVAGLLVLRTRGAAQSLPVVVPGGGTSLEVVPITPTTIRNEFVYSVPVLCGTVLTPTGSTSVLSLTADTARLVSGTYLTTIRIHNPDDQAAVSFDERAVEANPQLTARGRISPSITQVLQPEQALEFQCTELIRLLGYVPPSANIVLRSHAPLDVTAIYSAAGVVSASAAQK